MSALCDFASTRVSIIYLGFALERLAGSSHEFLFTFGESRHLGKNVSLI
jgi:hypothetical protein